jgi:hypothetical protein
MSLMRLLDKEDFEIAAAFQTSNRNLSDPDLALVCDTLECVLGYFRIRGEKIIHNQISIEYSKHKEMQRKRTGASHEPDDATAQTSTASPAK